MINWANRVLEPTGFLLCRSEHRADQERALSRIATRFPDLATVVDVGASDGRWSEVLLKRLRNARFLLIEAQMVHERALRRFCEKHPNCEFALAAAGAEVGQVHFRADNPFGGQASTTKRPDDVSVPVTTLDDEIDKRSLEGPFLLKFDTHGFELPILQGAKRTLEQTDVIVMECYNFPISADALVFYDMCNRLSEQGFRPLDLFDVLHRPTDGALWQFDIVFARETIPEFADNSYNG
jgi:FkbM family methyltransferase